MKRIIFAAVVVSALFVTSCGGGKNATVTKGSLSKLDTLSYAVGVNLASMIVKQLADLPLDYDVLTESLVKAAQGTNKVSHEDATASLQDYFMTKRQVRVSEVNKARDTADSVALANGADADAVREARKSLPADPAMFEDVAECKLISAALGNDLGTSIANAKIPAQTVWVKKSIEDVIAGEPKMTDAEASAQIQKFFKVTLPAANLAASEAWLASIEKKSGIQKTESGLLYKVENAGDESLKATDVRDVVKVKYTGKTREGKVFDSSRYADMDEQRLEFMKSKTEDGELTEEGEIVEFPLNRVIKGWTEGMMLVGKGGRISLWIPSEIAYGERGAGTDIGSNDALYFDVELVDVIPYEAPAPAPTSDEE